MEDAATHEEGFKANKVSLLSGGVENNYTAATYCILEEDHTLGNVLRWMLMKNPDVEFCGYSAPHPSEEKIHLRIQMYDGKSSLAALHEAIDNLESMTEEILKAYEVSLASGDFEHLEDEEYDFESVNERLWEMKGPEAREAFEKQKREKEESRVKSEDAVRPKKGKGVKAPK